MADIEAMYVYPGTMTSSPGPIAVAAKLVINADVPELTTRACFISNFLQTSSSTLG